MITDKKSSHVDVFMGSPWEAASVRSLLNAAYIEVLTREKGCNSIHLSVPCKYYTAAVRIIESRKGL